MAFHEQTKAEQRWRRGRRIRRLKLASAATFEGCAGTCYGVPFPPGGPGSESELTEEDLAHFEQILADYLP
jgi:hypothetical protein